MKNYPTNKIKNISLMGHGGSGKTTLIEAMLFNAGATKRMGKVENGNTVTDFDVEEKRRGMSTNTSYATCEWKDNKLNLIDTPGDFDFLSEQMLGMRVGDVVLLVATAKDGVSVGVEKTIRLASKKNQPLAITINAVDEPHTSFQETLEKFQATYGNKVVPIVLPIMEGDMMVGLVDVLDQKAYKIENGDNVPTNIPADMQEQVDSANEALLEQIAEADDELMMKYFEGEEFTVEEQQEGLRQAIQTEAIYPVFATSAVNNVGVKYLMDIIAKFFPSAAMQPDILALKTDGTEIELAVDENGPLVAFVFKTVVDPFVGRISMYRVYSGKVQDGVPVYNIKTHQEERVNGVYYLQGKKQIETDAVIAGDIGALTKLNGTQTNQTLSSKQDPLQIKELSLPTPGLTLAIEAVTSGEEDKVMQGMNRLRDEDVSFDIYNNPETKQMLISGMGEVQMDVLCQKLKANYGTEARLFEPKVAYRETIRKKIEVQGRHKKQSGGHGQFGDVWIRFEPGKSEELEFNQEIFGGSVPKNYHPAVEKGLEEACEEGVLAGYPVVHLKATLYDGSYHDVDSNEMSFKLAARLAYRNGLPKAEPVILEPIAALKVTIPDDYLGDIMGDMSKRRGRILGMGADANPGFQSVEAEAPMSELSKYATDLKSMTQGRGWFSMEFARYEEAPREIA
ncbi:MAG TPA: elongation factor G, partial [Candidatus Eisenbacteria bacterium]|nr:elongation factor G [Candidatus Eisenbacteria bacterium]